MFLAGFGLVKYVFALFWVGLVCFGQALMDLCFRPGLGGFTMLLARFVWGQYVFGRVCVGSAFFWPSLGGFSTFLAFFGWV